MKKKLKYISIISVLNFPIIVHATEGSEQGCTAILGARTTTFLVSLLSWIQIAGIFLAIILGMGDFIGAILSGESDSNKKSLKKLIIRVAMAAVLLITPAILKLVLTVFGVSSDGLCIV